METLIITSDDMSGASEIIRRGGLVAVPTETVYGLAANGLDAAAVARIYEVKGRPEEKPLSLLVSGLSGAELVCEKIPEPAKKLAAAFWPGPLTLVLKKNNAAPEIVTAGGDTIGVRCPDHPKTLELLRLAGVPLAAPSANISDMESPKSASAVLSYFDGKIDCVIDGGECMLGIESTVVDLSGDEYKILRQGALPKSEIRRALGL